MVNRTFTAALAVTTIFSFTAEANPHQYRHHHLRRATTPSYTLVYSGVKRVPDFDDCIDFTTLESSGTYSTVAKECASTADVPNTGAKFFAVYQTDDQKGTSFWWCGWWETTISDMADVTESYQEDGDAIYKAYGYNFTPPASSLTSSSSVKGSTSSSASTKGGTSTPASVKGTASTSTKVASPTSSSAKGAASTSVSSTTPVVNPSKSDSSTSAVKKSSSTSGTDAKPSSTSLKTTSTSSTINASISSAGSASSSANTSPSSASFLTSGNTSSSTHTGKTKLKTSSSSSTSSSTGTVSATPNVGSDLPATPTTLAKKASSTGSSSSPTGNTSSSIKKTSSSSAGKISSTTPSATTTSKVGTSSSGSQAPGKVSIQITPTGVTTVTYVATTTGIAGFSFVKGAINAAPSQNIINYWISDTDLNAKSPQVSCANHCSSDSSCKSFAVWAQKTWFNCVIYSVATTTSILETSNITTLDDGSISSAIIFNKGKGTNLSLKYSFENPKCGMKGFLWNSNAFPDSGLDDIDDIVTCANYCKSQSGCLTYEWQPSIQRCQTWNKDMFAAGYLTYDPTSTTFWYDLKCDVSKALSPTFRNTRLTADQKTKYCGIKGNYNRAASDNTYKVYNVATADECGKWCHVYPVFNSYRWSTTDGSCICQAPSIGMAVIANSSSTDVHYSMDCYPKMYYLYTNMTDL